MPRRGENVYKRKDGRWEGRILKPDGKYQYIYAKTYREIKEKKKNCQEHIKHQNANEACRVISAAASFEHWLENTAASQIKPSTYENYQYCIQKYVMPFFRKTENEKITASSAARFVKSVRELTALSEAYKRKLLSIFKTALREILKGSADYAAILETIKLPKSENNAVQVFSVKEQRLVENAVLNSDNVRSLGILLCFYTGIRLGELCALKWSDFDFDAGTMSIVRTVSRIKNFQQDGFKTMLYVGIPKSHKSVRKIPLPDFLLKHMDRLKKYTVSENNYILSDSEMPLDPRTYQKLFKKLLENAGVKNRKFHAIRHSFATRALELGVDIKTLSDILGHSNISITLNIYAHSMMDQKKIAISKFNDMHIMYMDVDAFAVSAPVITI